jgi:hypothetical protein
MVGMNEDYVMAKRPTEDAHGLTAFERKIIGTGVRLEIPFAGKYQLRQIADILRGYAEKIDFHTRRTDLKDWEILSYLKNEAKVTQMRIRETIESTGKGKAPKPYRQRLDEQ